MQYNYYVVKHFLLIFLTQSCTHNDAGEYDLASRFGSVACKCNLLSILPSVIMAIAVVVIVILLATGVLFAATAASDAASTTYDYEA